MVDNTEADDDGESHGRPESEWVIFKEKKCVNLKPFLWECWCASETKENNKTNPVFANLHDLLRLSSKKTLQKVGESG